MKKLLILSENNEFIIILHAYPDAHDGDGKFQWYIIDEPNSDNVEMLENEIYESCSLSSEFIHNKYKGKWIYCHCEVAGESYNEGCIMLTDDFITIIKNNQFDEITFFDNKGRIRTDIYYKGKDLNSLGQ